ncbi:MAG: diaminopimelate epimerase [Thermodesulfobacteriota bacterium]|nr:diaminopimelate epimerase [Thermodesulfobacteriota bacterium]
MSGSGNDFIVIDNREKLLSHKDAPDFARSLCRRKVSIGADGLILIEASSTAHFKWRFFNSDGSEAAMCGNGGRCAARFAYFKNIAPGEMFFETKAGIVKAKVTGNKVKLLMTAPKDLKDNIVLLLNNAEFKMDFIDTGVPHVVIFNEDIEKVEVTKLGRQIRFNPLFAPAGTNVNFVTVENKAELNIRTYERGVEDETLACGTGSVAAAIIAARKGLVDPPVKVKVRSGEMLEIYFKDNPNKEDFDFGEVFLEGGAFVIYEGLLWSESLNNGGKNV